MVENTRLGRFCQVRNALPLQQRQQECRTSCNILHLVAVNVTGTYRISSIRRRGYDLPRCLFCGSVYFFRKPGDINDGWIRYVQMGRWRLLDVVSNTRSFSVLLSAVGTTRTAQTVLALAWWPSSEIICVHTCARAWFTSRGDYILEGGVYLDGTINESQIGLILCHR